MTKTVEIVAIGPFRRHLLKHFSLPEIWYSGTKESMPVMTTILSTDQEFALEPLAAAFGVNPSTSGEWRIKAANIVDTDVNFVLSTIDRSDLDASVFRSFAAAGYSLYFNIRL